MFSLFISIDMINGYLIRNGFFSISLILKTLTLVFVIIYLLKNRQTMSYVLILISVILFYLIIHSFILSDILYAIQGLDWLIKFLSIVIFYIFFSRLIIENKEDKVIKIVSYTFVFLIINFIIGYLGYGYPMYGEEDTAIGTRGLIYAGNEIGAAIIISGAILQMYFIEQRKYLNFLFVGILMMAMGALLTSKVSILASILISLFFPLIKSSEKLKVLKINKKDFKYSFAILSILPLLSLGLIYYALYVSNLMDRFSFFYDKVDIVTLLLSQRNIWALEAIHIFINNYTLSDYIFGMGIEWYKFISENKAVEIDIIDFTMAYGLLGFLLSYGFFVFVLIKSILCKNNRFRKYIIFISLLILTISCTGGHIFNSGTAGFLIAIVLAYKNYKNKEIIQ